MIIFISSHFTAFCGLILCLLRTCWEAEMKWSMFLWFFLASFNFFFLLFLRKVENLWLNKFLLRKATLWLMRQEERKFSKDFSFPFNVFPTFHRFPFETLIFISCIQLFSFSNLLQALACFFFPFHYRIFIGLCSRSLTASENKNKRITDIVKNEFIESHGQCIICCNYASFSSSSSLCLRNLHKEAKK